MTESRHTQQPERPKKKKKKYKIHWLRIILAVLLLTIVVGSGVVLGIVYNAVKDMPPLDDSTLSSYEISSYILDKDGNYVDKLHAGEYRVPVTFSEISPNMINALVAIEDQRFYTHKGIDPIRIAGAMVANVKAGRVVQGGSTITQQLAGMAMLDRTEKSYTRKIQEAAIAFSIEQNYSKDEIITMYLNRVFFGNNAYGIQAAAETFFNKDATDLTVTESALLAGMIQNPSKWSPTRNPENALKRRNIVLGEMVDTGALTQSEADAYKAEPITLAEFQTAQTEDTAQYANQSFIDHVINEAIDILDLADNSRQLYTGGYIIHTTLDTNLQGKMEEIYNDDTQFPKGDSTSILQSAMVLMNSTSGEVRALVGGRNLTGARNLNRATQSVRQPGSSFKPIAVYGPAFEAGYSPGTVIDDYPKSYGGHVFKNYDHKYRGLMTCREAIKNSTNVVAVKLLEKIGVENGFKFAEKLGITSLVSEGPNNDLNLSMALGGLTQGVSPLEMAGAYGAFANKGIYTKPYVITQITDSKGKVLYENEPVRTSVMSEETAYMISSSLVSVVSESGGTGSVAAIKGRQVAGKTGTTSDNKDYWFMGYTPQYVCAVWMGYDQPREIKSVTSAGRSCGPLFQKMMAYAHQDLPVVSFEKPDGITTATIDTKSGLLPSALTPAEYQKSEIFNKNAVPKEVSTAWEEVEIDPLSGELFTDKCPGTAEVKVFLHRETPWQDDIASGFTPADASLEAPTEPCSLHADGMPVGDFFLSGNGRYTDGQLRSAELAWQNYNTTSLNGVYYEIYRSTHGGFTADSTTLIGNSTGTVYTDASPSTTERNVYKVVVKDKATHEQLAVSNEVALANTTSAAPSDTSNEAPADSNEPSNVPTDEPAVPDTKPSGGETAASIALSGSSSGSSVNLSWNAPGSGSYQYFVFRSESPSVAASSSNQIGGGSIITATSYSDTSAQAGTTYYYKVLAFNRETNERVAASNEISVTR